MEHHPLGRTAPSRSVALRAVVGLVVVLAVLGAGASSAISSSGGAGASPPGNLHVPVLQVGNGHAANMSLEAPGGKQVSTVTWAIGGDIVKFDPAFAYDYNSTPVVSQGCEGLLRYDNGNGKLLPNLASSWSEPNPLTYVYNVRKGVHFWDGTEMTPQDVLFSMKRIMDPKTGAYGSFYYANVKSISLSAPWQITVKLKRSDTQWKYVPAMSAMGAVMSEAYAQAHAKNLGQPGVGVMCTGPFKFVSWERGQQIVMQRFDGYWNKAKMPKVENLIFKIIPDSATLIAALNSGAVDGTLYGFDGRMAQQLTGPVNLITSPSDTYFALYFNTARKPWDDVRVRQAFAYALDRTGIISSVYNGLGVNTKSPVPPILWTYSHDDFAKAYAALPDYNLDLAKAKALIAAAGAQGTKATLMLGTPTDQRVALFVQQAASELGIALTLRTVPFAQKTAIEYNNGPKNYDLDLVAASSDTPDPLNNLFLAFNSANVATDLTVYKNAAVDKWLVGAQSAPNTAIEATDTIKAQAQIIKDVPMIPYIAADSLVPLNKRLTGFIPTFFSYWTPWAADLSGT
jgi:peptide/nickel transport system substrate-binding protein